MADNAEGPDYREVLIGGVEKVEIRIVDYDSAWADKFREHAARIKAALGPAALQVEHIGSTSVPGLPAKPIIDILLVVQNSADESTYLPALEAAGYQLRVRDPADNEHRMLRTPTRDVHIHVYSAGCFEVERLLAFRDRLRESASERELYSRTKRELATREWRHMNAYADAKAEVIKGIISRSRAGRG
jgi:GrpB-like predicted nucleotidyltransferase (UPF0157 family)